MSQEIVFVVVKYVADVMSVQVWADAKFDMSLQVLQSQRR